MKHPDHVPGYDSPKELAKAISITSYDYALELFSELALEYSQQAQGDQEKGRKQLSAGLEEVVQKLRKVWNICKPYMEKE